VSSATNQINKIGRNSKAFLDMNETGKMDPKAGVHEKFTIAVAQVFRLGP
jgi:hypothetical protein